MQDHRENDKIILDRLDKLQETSTKTQIDLALNTRATQGVEEHLKTLNGKVAAHETRMQSVEGAQAITSTAVAEIKQINLDTFKKRSSDYDKVKWIAIGLGITFIGNVILFLIRSDILKKIYT
ncbi:MAG: hypothetical protein H0X02_09775 [Nitrosomonas sp.]|jgi:uncharacterized protein (DUF3084 family)|nr:hypothetical protein [Nitrosomonas sp.]